MHQSQEAHANAVRRVTRAKATRHILRTQDQAELLLEMLGLTPPAKVDASKCPHCGHKLNLDMRPCRRADCLRDRGIEPTPRKVDA